MKKRLLFLLFCLPAFPAFAVRPFITDDAAVVGRRLAQLETRLMFDRFGGGHWAMLAYGPHERVEVAVGGVWGYDRLLQPKRTEIGYAAPLVEVKYLFRDYNTDKFPGVALVGGTFLPAGRGDFAPPGPGAYSYLALTQCFGKDERVLLHGNLGVNYLRVGGKDDFAATWGLGTQIKAYKGLHLVGEVVSGDPYIAGSGLLYQTGVRYFVSDLLQLDATLGQGLAGENKVPFWAGLGARMVMTRFRKKQS